MSACNKMTGTFGANDTSTLTTTKHSLGVTLPCGGKLIDGVGQALQTWGQTMRAAGGGGELLRRNKNRFI